MKHYRFPILTVLCLAALLSSCSSDDEGGSNFPTSISQTIQAEWYSPEAERYMKFEYMYVSGKVYQNMSTFPEIAESFSGQWMYSKGGVLVMDIMYEKSAQLSSEDYYVLQCDDKTLKVRHTSLGLTINFYKIIESYNARIGDRFDIEYVKQHSDFSSATYTSSNPSIAEVDDNGRVLVRGGGLAFITVSSSAGIIVVRVDGGQRIDSYTAAIPETIDQVMARHGEPDGNLTSKFGNPLILYVTPQKIIDSAVNKLAYVYDPDTHEVTLVEIHYMTEANRWFQSDEEYLIRDFYIYLNNAGTYAPNYSLLDNHFSISVVKTANENGMMIHNRDYISKHGHY